MKKINHSKLRKCLSIFILMHIIFFVGCVSEYHVLKPEECFKKLKYSVSGRIAWGAAALATSISFGSFGTFFNYKNPLLLIAAGSPFSIISAGKVNRAFKAELENYDLLNETIMPGMEKSGLICIKAQSVQDILIRIEQ